MNQIEQNPKKYAESLSVKELVKLLKKYSDAYYNTDISLSVKSNTKKYIVSDKVFDVMKEVLESRDPTNKFLKQVGAPIKINKEKITLPFEMGSLSKIKYESGDEINKFLLKYSGPYVVSDKLDGASMQLYKDSLGKIHLYSRGDGVVGQNISYLLDKFVSKDILQNIPSNTSIRGELIISKNNFKKISDRMKNARNTVSGLVNSKNIDEEVAQITQFVVYAVISPRYEQQKQMELLKSWGFDVVEYKKTNKLELDDLKKYLLERKNKSKFEIDGVVCVDDSQIYPHTGGYPDHAFAFKMVNPDEVVETIVKEVLWEPSKDAYMKPRIRIQPVELTGTTVEYATAFNAKYILDNCIGKGTRIKITRSGDVIPYILEVLTKSDSGKPQMPESDCVWNKSGVDLIINLDSNGVAKNIVRIKILTRFFEKIGVVGLGEGIVTKLVDNKYDTIEKILTAKEKDLILIEGLGKKIVTKIYTDINRAFDTIRLETFMSASNMFGRGLGEKKLKEVLNKFPDIMNLNWNTEQMREMIQTVQGFSTILTDLFVDDFPKFIKFYSDISKIKDLSRFKSNVILEPTNNMLAEQKIVFTGCRPSAELEQKITSSGGKIISSVSSKTTILVHADDSDTSSVKFIKAKELGIRIISMSDFVTKYKLKN